MDTLDGTDWDVVIGGTGLPESLLALSLSRTDKKILHLDPNPYYGGNEAGLSLDEATEWASKNVGAEGLFGQATVWVPTDDGSEELTPKLASSRAYALALAPQILYAQSKIVPALVSSQAHNQLEFQAVGSWFILQPDSIGGPPRLSKVPSSREDVFSDDSMGDLRAKRSLMKFLRFVGTFEEQEQWQDMQNSPFAEVLEEKFKLPADTHGPLLALALSVDSPKQTTFGKAVPAIARHLRSIGTFGPGFAAVIPKWGGLAEICQAACRACAVGGAVYVLNKSWTIEAAESGHNDIHILKLDQGEKISTRWLVDSSPGCLPTPTRRVAQSISIASSTFSTLYPLTSEGGVIPAAAVVTIPSSDLNLPPIHLTVHSSEAGECPTGQCVLYTSTEVTDSHNDDDTFARLEQSVAAFINAVEVSPSNPRVLWRLQFIRTMQADIPDMASSEASVIRLKPLRHALVVEDDVLDSVERAWKAITGGTDEEFMRFRARHGMIDDQDEA